MWKSYTLPVLLLAACVADTSALQSGGGAVPIRIASDGATPRCVDGVRDSVWLTLRRVVTKKSKRWFKEDSSVALFIQAHVRTHPQTPKLISFPLMTETTLRGFSEGQVSVPIEYSLIDGLALTQEKVRYSGVELELTLLNNQGKRGWGRALQALSEVTKKLPIPGNPYTQSASYLLDFANAAVSRDLEDQAADHKARAGALTLNFDPTGACEPGTDFESTGTVAILQEGGVRGPFYVDVDQADAYCWTADLKPVFVLKAAKREPGLSCEDSRHALRYATVTNDYLAFFLNAVPTARSRGGLDHDREQALKRCQAHGIPKEDCL